MVSFRALSLVAAVASVVLAEELFDELGRGRKGHWAEGMRVEVADCKSPYKLKVTGTPSCEQIADHQAMTVKALLDLNSWLDCNKPLPDKTIVCLPSAPVIQIDGDSQQQDATNGDSSAPAQGVNAGPAGAAPTQPAGPIGGAIRPKITGTLAARRTTLATSTSSVKPTSAAAKPTTTAANPDATASPADITTDAVTTTQAAPTPDAPPPSPPSAGCLGNMDYCKVLADSDNPPYYAGSGAPTECTGLTNYARQHYNPGTFDLYWDDNLAYNAQYSAEWAATYDCTHCHTRSGGGDYNWGQNLYLGQCSCTDAYNGWVRNEAAGNDPYNPDAGHFLNIVGFEIDYRSVGCASAQVDGRCATVCNYGL
ncbi:hypothetical protein HDU81_001614 [Chytriomyces hyalinus]|nr:hypothetical protein HDU81_001614 [Chytriomyces hyalinus]